MTQPPPASGSSVNSSVIEAATLRKTNGDLVAVDDIDIRVPRGSCFGLLGPNGAGKTTFLRMVVGKTPPSGGRLEVLGLPVPAAAGRMRARLGMVPQLDNLDPDFTVAENLRMYARYFGLAGPVIEQRIVSLLEFAVLEQRADARINALSGGMQRRLSLCRALVNEPDLLILDEPTTGLDPQARQMIWQKLRQLRARGTTLVLTTHYLDEAERLCDYVAIMDHGRVLDGDAPQTLISRHIEPQVVEVYGPGLEDFHAAAGEQLAERSELVGETRFYYVHEERALLEALDTVTNLRFLHRRATLEDVFVKLTGRDLRDG